MALQCKNCGLRFAPKDMAYSQHLDWHFRLKKREKENHKRAQSRRWYLEQRDWIISNEIDDNLNEAFEEDGDNAEQSEAEIPTVPASANPDENRCPVCHEDFDQLFKEDNPEADDDAGQWHLKNAVRPDGPGARAFHPLCHADAKNLDMEFEEDEEEAIEAAAKQPEEKPEEEKPAEENLPTIKIEVPEIKVESMETESGGDAKAASNETPEAADHDGLAPVKEENEENDEAEKAETEQPSETEVKTEEKEEELDVSLNDLGNLTADAGVTAPPSFPISAGIKINLSSQVSYHS